MARGSTRRCGIAVPERRERDGRTHTTYQVVRHNLKPAARVRCPRRPGKSSSRGSFPDDDYSLQCRAGCNERSSHVPGGAKRLRVITCRGGLASPTGMELWQLGVIVRPVIRLPLVSTRRVQPPIGCNGRLPGVRKRNADGPSCRNMNFLVDYKVERGGPVHCASLAAKGCVPSVCLHLPPGCHVPAERIIQANEPQGNTCVPRGGGERRFRRKWRCAGSIHIAQATLDGQRHGVVLEAAETIRDGRPRAVEKRGVLAGESCVRVCNSGQEFHTPSYGCSWPHVDCCTRIALRCTWKTP